MIENIRELYRLLKKERFFTLLAVTGAVIVYAALAIYFATATTSRRGRRSSGCRLLGSGDGGDRGVWRHRSVSNVGRSWPWVIILKRVGLLSLLLQPSHPSLWREKYGRRRLGNHQGKGHVIICGWNENAEKVIESIFTQTGETLPRWF